MVIFIIILSQDIRYRYHDLNHNLTFPYFCFRRSQFDPRNRLRSESILNNQGLMRSQHDARTARTKQKQFASKTSFPKR